MRKGHRLELARSLVAGLRKREGRNLVAAGVFGSVARGEDRRHSDVDILVVVRRKRRRIHHEVRDGIVLTVLQQTPDEAEADVTGTRGDLNSVLGGWTSLRPLYDPGGLLVRLRAKARRPRARQFREAARWVVFEAYEDVGKLWNATEARDPDEAREMAIWFTGAASGAVLDMDARILKTGRQAFVEMRRYGKLGTAIRHLRYDSLTLAELNRLSEFVWGGLLDLADEKGISLPPFPRQPRGTL